MVTQLAWSVVLTRAVAGEIRRYRTERGLSAQQLAAKCCALGLDMSRAMIADLENGRRVAISIAELIIFARALDIPPIALIAPVGRQETMEIFPGQRTGVFDAMMWFAGQAGLVGTDGTKEAPNLVAADIGDSDDLSLYYMYTELIRRWRRIAARPELLRDAEMIEMLEESFRLLRSRMAERGLIVPPLPRGLEHLG